MLYIKSIFFIIFLKIIILSIIAHLNSYTYKHGKDMNGVYILPDIIHNNCKHNIIYDKIAEYGVFTIMIGVALILIINKNYKLLIIYVILFFIFQIICRLMFIATILPDSKNGNCKYSKDIIETAFINKGSCNCLNVSGHLLTTGIALYILYLQYDKKYINLFISIYIIMFFAISASRNHYTIDCINSTILLLLLITNYDSVLKLIYKITNEKLINV